MTVSLQKGANVSLSQKDSSLKVLLCGLGWDSRLSAGEDFDLDASVFMVTETGKVRQDSDFIFYNNMKDADGSVEYLGDNRTGAGDGDDEQVIINVDKIPADIVKLVFVASIHEAAVRKQNFGHVQNAFMRLSNMPADQELARFELGDDFGTETSVIFGEVYRYGVEWKFKAVGQGVSGGLTELAKNYGVNI